MDEKINISDKEKCSGIDVVNSNIILNESVVMATLGVIDNAAANASLQKSDVTDSTFSSIDKENNSTNLNDSNASSDGILKIDVSSNSDTKNVILDNSANKNDAINNNANVTNTAMLNSTETKQMNDNVSNINNVQVKIINQDNIKLPTNSVDNSAIRNDAENLKQMRSTSVQIVPNSNIRTISDSNIQTVPNPNIRTVPNSNIQIVPNVPTVPNPNMQRPNIQPLNSLPGQPIRSPAPQPLSRNPPLIPIIGYEVMEERARFTIYKLRVDDPRTALSWLVFRRYTDFVRLHSKLKSRRNILFPLPEKRLFKDNFDPAFLDNRARGLQAFVNAVMKALPNDTCVREFFCLDEPPPAVGDSEPEAQALFGVLEDTVGALRDQIRQKEEALEYLRRKVFYLEERSRSCGTCNPTVGSPDSSGSSNGS